MRLAAMLRRSAPDDRAARSFARSISEWNNPAIRVLSPDARGAIASLLASSVREAYPEPPLSAFAGQVADEMATVGYCRIVPSLPSHHVAEIIRYFEKLPCLNKHVETHSGGDGVRRDPRGEARIFPFGTYSLEEVLTAPHLLETATAPPILDAVEAFLGARPTIFSLNAYWSFPQKSGPSVGQDFHRDMSHPKFCVLFIYLTDTDENCGPHQYIRSTSNPDALAKVIDCEPAQFFGLPRDGCGFTDLYERHLSSLVDTITGAAGTMFLEDAYGLHRGFAPIAGPRLMAWARYSVFAEPPVLPKKAQRSVLGGRYPKDERAQYALRSIVSR